jgi:hypothetical protein
MSIIIRWLAGSVLLCVIAAPAQAALTVSMYQNLKNTGQPARDAKMFIAGLGYGFRIANIELSSSNRPELFCQPLNMTINFDQYAAVINKEISSRATLGDPYTGDTDIARVLLNGLRRTLPCS